MANRLFELSEIIQQIDILLDNETTTKKELNEAIAIRNDAIAETEEKLTNLAKYVRKMEYELEIAKAEKQRINNYKISLEKKIKTIREIIADIMSATNIKKIKNITENITLKQGNENIEIVDESMIPEQFIIVVKEIDKKAINEYYKQTGIIPAGCAIKQGEPYVVISGTAKNKEDDQEEKTRKYSRKKIHEIPEFEYNLDIKNNIINTINSIGLGIDNLNAMCTARFNKSFDSLSADELTEINKIVTDKVSQIKED